MILFKICFLQPTLHIQWPIQVIKRQVNHTTTWHSGRWRNRKVLDFEQHSQLRSELDSFSIGQAKSHVIVEHGIHVFNPKRIHRTVKDNPIFFIWIPFWIVDSRCVYFSDNWTCKTVNPFLSEWVNLTVHFAHRNWFWVHNFVMSLLKSFDLLFFHDWSTMSQHFETGWLSTSCLTNQHDTKSDIKSIIKLNDFLFEWCVRLKLFLCQFGSQNLLQLRNWRRRNLSRREQVINEGCKQWNVSLNELWNVGELHGLDENTVFFQVGFCSF